MNNYKNTNHFKNFLQHNPFEFYSPPKEDDDDLDNDDLDNDDLDNDDLDNDDLDNVDIDYDKLIKNYFNYEKKLENKKTFLSSEYILYKINQIINECDPPLKKLSDKEIKLIEKYGTIEEWKKLLNKLGINSLNIDLTNRTHNSLPIPVKIDSKFTTYNKTHYECACKRCISPNLKCWDHCAYIWNSCLICETPVWYYPEVCSLYGKRSPFIVCFLCRIPHYDRGMTNGQIHKLGMEIYKNRKIE